MWTHERRLALFGARLLRVILVFSVIACLLVSLFMAYLAYQVATGSSLEGVTINVPLPVKLTIAKSAYDISVGKEVQFDVKNAGIVLPWTAIPKAAHLLLMLAIPCGYAFYTYVIFCLQRMFATFAAGRPFQSASVRALRLIAWVLIVQYAIDQFSRLLGYWILGRIEVSGEVSVAPSAWFGASAGLNLATGVTLLLIAWAFSRAAVIEQERDTLQEEQNLTV